MDKHEFDRKEDTGKIELQSIIDFLIKTGYQFESSRDSSSYYQHSVASFTKDIKYTDKYGDWINDRHIRIKIEYDNDFDYKHIKKDVHGYYYDSYKRCEFIEDLVNNTYDDVPYELYTQTTVEEEHQNQEDKKITKS